MQQLIGRQSLPIFKYNHGKQIVYTVTEDTVANYSAAIDGTTITNSYKPGKTSVTVTKRWEDNNDQDGKRPKAPLRYSSMQMAKLKEKKWNFLLKITGLIPLAICL